MDYWHATHKTFSDEGEETLVMLYDNDIAYTREEWDAELDRGEYELRYDGTWLFRGRPFKGKVEALSGPGSPGATVSPD